jgi:hypothetical protein
MKKIGRDTHAKFDKAQISSPVGDLTPNYRALWSALQCYLGTDALDIDNILTHPENLCVFADSSPFLKVSTLAVETRCSLATYGLDFETDPMSHRNIFVDVFPLSSCSLLPWNKHLKFHTVVQGEDIPVFTISEVSVALWTINVDTQTSFRLSVAPYNTCKKEQQAPLPKVAPE